LHLDVGKSPIYLTVATKLSELYSQCNVKEVTDTSKLSPYPNLKLMAKEMQLSIGVIGSH
jgi:hypothetical protein